jgi:RHS repeat-associated protein
LSAYVRGASFTTRSAPGEIQDTRSFTYDLDGLGRIAQVVGPLGHTPHIYAYAYDGVGNLTRIDDNGSSGFVMRYEDPVRPNALTRSVPIGSGITRDFLYDDAGRVRQQAFSGLVSATRLFEYDSHGRPSRAGDFHLGHDAAGQRIRTYVLPDGAEGKIAHPEPGYSFEGGQSQKHFFVDGRRIASAAHIFVPPSADSPLLFLRGRGPDLEFWLGPASLGLAWGAAAALLVAFALGRPARRPLRLRAAAVGLLVVAGPSLLGARPRVTFGSHNEDRLFYVTDHLGGTILAVRDLGTLRNRFLHDPFGGVLVAEGDSLEKRWIGGSMLPSPGTEYATLYALGPRLYDPNMGRFLQPDPLLGNPALPQSSNAYGYALNSPLDAKDPSGYAAACEDTVGGCGSAGGLGSYDQIFCEVFGCGQVYVWQQPVAEANNVPATNIDAQSQGREGGLEPQPGEITSPYSPAREHPVLGTVRPHTGVDIRTPGGDPVRARISGQVDFAGRATGYGGTLVIGGDYLRDGTTRVFTLQGHLTDFQVERGAYVLRGDIVGFAATRRPDIGTATAPHEHLGLYLLPRGATFQMPSPYHVDPMTFDWTQLR